ncbi:MAG TPA: hypothetical protein VGP07_24665 [Polyangia bacterium]|jgi:hypothetical protein
MHLRLVGAHEAVSLVGAIVMFGFLAVAGRRALVQAHSEAPSVLAGMRLALGALAASVLGAGTSGLVYYSETSCTAGSPDIPLPPLCTLVTVSRLLFLAAVVIFLASLVVWPPWRGPLRLQLARATLGLGWAAAFVLGVMATGFLFGT